MSAAAEKMFQNGYLVAKISVDTGSRTLAVSQVFFCLRRLVLENVEKLSHSHGEALRRDAEREERISGAK